MVKLNKRKKDRNIRITFISIISLAVIILIFFRTSDENSLEKHGYIGNAHIYLINRGSLKGGKIVIKYYFDYNGKKIYGGLDSWLSYRIRSRLLNNKFPVLIDSTNPENNVLLVSPNWWRKINLEMPDSIKWITSNY